MKIRNAKRAYSDQEQILDYLRARSPTGAANVLNRIGTALEILAEQPLMGHATNIADVRLLLVGRYPYKIFYAAAAGGPLLPLDFRHQRSSWDSPAQCAEFIIRLR